MYNDSVKNWTMPRRRTACGVFFCPEGGTSCFLHLTRSAAGILIKSPTRFLTLKEKKDSVFYAAEYTFNVRDKEAAYKDLKEKLSILYGNAIETEENDVLTSFASETPTKINAKMYMSVWNVRADDVTVILNMECNDGAEEDINASVWYNCLTLSYVKTSYESQIQKVDAVMGGYLDNAEKENAVSDFDGL